MINSVDLYTINLSFSTGNYFFPSCCQEFSVDPVDRFVPPEFVMKHGFYSSDPVKHSLDGAFAARLLRAL